MMTIRMNWVIAIIVKLSLYCFWDVVVAFPVTPPLALVVPLRSAHPKIRSPTTSTTLYGLLGRFRNKRTVEQGKMIQPGSELPKVDVEQLVFSPDGGPATSEAVAILDVVGTTTKALLIGMPGAFTTTCSAEHLPGYVKSADKLKALGIEKIAVITTNDRFVNEEWSNQQGLAKTKANDNMITILSDGDGDLVKNMGLAEDMGFGVGIRSKRFAMVVENGKVVDLFLDQGMEDCSATSAENVIKLLTPEVVAPEATEVDGKVIVGGVLVAVGALVLALLASQPSVDGAATTTPSRPRAAPQVRVEPPTKSSSSRQSESQFQLLNQYMSK